MSTKNRIVLAATALAMTLFTMVGRDATADTIVVASETFEGYQFQPWQSGFAQNFGVPLTSEGADSDLWLGTRFEAADSDPISNDISVQKSGGNSNPSQVGRVDDDAGLVMRLDLTGLSNVSLKFDWRTYLTEQNNDRFVVAYYQGDGTEFQAEGLGSPGNIYNWYADPQLGTGVMNGTTNDWYTANWTELLRDRYEPDWKHYDSVADDNLYLPGGDILYLAFWMDNGNGDHGKLDNLLITAESGLVPEPSSALLLLLGVSFSLAVGARRTRS